MGYERLWQRLLERLEGVGPVDVRDGRLVVTPTAGAERAPVEIVMTPDQWDDLVTIPFGDFDAAAEYLTRRWAGLAADQPFLVYELYALEPSTTPDLPPDPGEERVVELLARRPEGVGQWYADKPGGGPEALGPGLDG